jgi:hypothetical protein
MLEVKRGSFVKLNGALCVVIGLAGETVGAESVPEDHVAVWYGEHESTRLQEGALEVAPEVWTVPLEYLGIGPAPTVRH